MSSRQEDSNGFDLEKLNDQDKAELRQFVAKTQQRTQIQSQTHKLTQMCWKKCVSGSIKNAQLGRSEETCLTNCVERFLDLSLVTVKHLTKGTE